MMMMMIPWQNDPVMFMANCSPSRLHIIIHYCSTVGWSDIDMFGNFWKRALLPFRYIFIRPKPNCFEFYFKPTQCQFFFFPGQKRKIICLWVSLNFSFLKIKELISPPGAGFKKTLTISFAPFRLTDKICWGPALS